MKLNLFCFTDYPSCNQDQCVNAQGCACPFTTTEPLPSSEPMMPGYNSQCSCAVGYSGTYCETGGMFICKK